jgi:hypothetical protein
MCSPVIDIAVIGLSIFTLKYIVVLKCFVLVRTGGKKEEQNQEKQETAHTAK